MDCSEVDQLLEDLNKLNRTELKEQLMSFKGTFHFDFTAEHLDKLSDERLRHILFAAYIYAHQTQPAIAVDTG